MSSRTEGLQIGDYMYPTARDGFNYYCHLEIVPAENAQAVCTSQFGAHWQQVGTVFNNTIPRPETRWDFACAPSRTPKCQLTKATGDPSHCCTTGQPLMAYSVCDKKYVDNRFKSTECHSRWVSKCNSSNIGSDNACRTWADNNPKDPYVQTAMAGYCSDKLNTQECRDWCVANPGRCDTAAKTYCSTGGDTTFCTCLNSPVITKAGLNLSPACVDIDCRDGVGVYKSSEMASDTCPITITECTQIQNLAAGGLIKIPKTVQDMECGTAATQADPNKVIHLGPTSDGSSDDESEGSSDGDFKQILYAIKKGDLGELSNKQKGVLGLLFVMILMVVLLPVFLLLLSGGKKSQSNSNMNPPQMVFMPPPSYQQPMSYQQPFY